MGFGVAFPPPSSVLQPLSASYNRTASLILQCDYKLHHSELYSGLNWLPLSTKPEYYHSPKVYTCRNNVHHIQLIRAITMEIHSLVWCFIISRLAAYDMLPYGNKL